LKQIKTGESSVLAWTMGQPGRRVFSSAVCRTLYSKLSI